MLVWMITLPVQSAMMMPSSGANKETVGDALINRFFNDGTNGAIFLADEPFGISGFVTEWAFFDDDGSGRSISPMVFQEIAGNYFIRGVGNPRISDGSGIQRFGFDLNSGTSAVKPGWYFGWVDRGGLTYNIYNNGVADFGDPSGDGTGVLHFGSGSITVGTDKGAGTPLDRDYSVQFTVEKLAVPEPSTAIFIFFGFALIRLGRHFSPANAVRD
ncbi:MAG: hypothetical protein ACI9TH_001348 [Kiritimatiellia bacterium]|jgi:hypothetical protein